MRLATASKCVLFHLECKGKGKKTPCMLNSGQGLEIYCSDLGSSCFSRVIPLSICVTFQLVENQSWQNFVRILL